MFDSWNINASDQREPYISEETGTEQYIFPAKKEGEQSTPW
jgi:hypothetical protein